MTAERILTKLRTGAGLSRDELSWFARALADDTVSDAQAGAFAMGVILKGLDASARADLTCAMRDSGRVLDWSGLDRPVVDKHSTGGVGDAVSLILAPALAACGAAVPMISGRGLGHTGGTLDKLESIPGLRTQVCETELYALMKQIGVAIVGASGAIAPADKRLYGVRDATGTVPSLDLITASILSKKLAASPDALILDVKMGSGAWMKTLPDAQELAKALVQTANAAGCKTSALITDMNAPLIPALGNALEVAEVVALLKDPKPCRMLDLCAALGAPLLRAVGLNEDGIWKALNSGAAAEKFDQMIAAQGGPRGFLDQGANLLPEATVICEAPAPGPGFINAIEGEALGQLVKTLGGGRQVETDQIDPSVGLSHIADLGARVETGDPLAMIHAANEEDAEAAISAVQAAMTLSEEAPTPAPLIHAEITA